MKRKKSIGGIDNNIIASIVIIVSMLSSVVGIFIAFAALILEVDDFTVRYYSKNMIICCLIKLILVSFFIKYISLILVSILLIIMLIALVKAYNLEIWELPLITYILNKLSF